MIREARITRIEDGRIIAGCDQSACEGCRSSTFCRGKKDEFEVLNPDSIPLKEGDDVIIGMDGRRTVAASAISLAFPLLCFLIGLVAGRVLRPASEPLQLLFAVIAMLLGFGLAAIYFHFTKKRYMPSVRKRKGE